MNNTITVINLDFVNAYLVKGTNGFILIDTGMASQWDQMEKGLVDAGCLAGQLKLIVVTHGDMDHTGNAPQLRENYNVKIAMHAGDLAQVANGVFLKRTVRPLMYRIMYTFRMLKRKLTGNKMVIPQFKPDILLLDGQSMEEYGVSATVIHIPGHTPGSIGILTGEGDLFAGDTFVNRKKPEAAQLIENATQLEHSLAVLKKMNIRTVYPGHGKPFLMNDYLQAL